MVRRCEIVNFITPQPKGSLMGVKNVKLTYSLKIVFPTLVHGSDKLYIVKCIVMMTKEGSTIIVNFMTPGAGCLVLRCGHISRKVKMH